jgi:hypothetical protein
MDRGYIDFGRLYGLHQAGAFFVTRAKSNPHPSPGTILKCDCPMECLRDGETRQT